MTDIADSAYTTVPKVSDNAKNVQTINFINDGLLAFGQSWYRGQEITVDKDTDWYKVTLDADGKSWLDMTPSEQIARYGEQKFQQGEWAGSREFDLDAIDPLTGKGLSDEDKELLREKSEKSASSRRTAK